MPITFQICIVYNKNFYCNLNDLACVTHPLLFCCLWSFLAFSSLGWLQDRIDEQTYLSFVLLIDCHSGGFESFLQDKCSSSNDTLDRSKCMFIPHQRCLSFILPASMLLWGSGMDDRKHTCNMSCC
jgi:hypothetical protein